MLLGIDHIELIVRDVDESVAFFQKMGFELLSRTLHHGGSAEVRLPGEGQTIFELHTVHGEENPGVNHIAFRCDDVASTHRELKGAGVRLDTEPRLVPQSGRTIVNFRDPDGWRLQLVDPKRATPPDGH